MLGMLLLSHLDKGVRPEESKSAQGQWRKIPRARNPEIWVWMHFHHRPFRDFLLGLGFLI